jgi:hypothetical protein
MLTEISDFHAIDTDKIIRIGAFHDKNKETNKMEYTLCINFEFSKLVLYFKDAKSGDEAYKEFTTDINNNTVKPKYKFKNFISLGFDDINILVEWFRFFNSNFVNLNDNLLDALSQLK